MQRNNAASMRGEVARPGDEFGSPLDLGKGRGKKIFNKTNCLDLVASAFTY